MAICGRYLCISPFFVFASIPSLDEIGGLLNAAPTGFEVSPKSTRNLVGPGNKNLGNLAIKGNKKL